MPESRDRRVLPAEDLAAIFARRRAAIVFHDHSPVTPRPRPRPRAPHAPGSQNTPPSGSLRRGRPRVPSRSLLPPWYPRTPLRDITAVVRAIERRRTRLGEDQGRPTENAVPAQTQPLPEASESASASASASASRVSKSPKSVGVKLRTPFGSKVPKIFLDISDLPEGGESSETLTPQKKLLNNIDQVEEAVREELKRLKRTPSAKKAEREKRVRTLMSMR